MADRILAVDVGGTKILGGLLDAEKQVLLTRQRPSGGVPGAADPGLSVTMAVAAELVGLAVDRGDRIVAVGAGFPEYVHRGRLTSSEVLDWRHQPGSALAALVPDAPVVIESDVRCAAVGEQWARRRGRGGDREIGCRAGDRADLGEDSMLYVSWGTGLSSTLVLGGRCLAGARGEAIALGEWEVSCEAGTDARGALEPYASGAGITRRYRELARGQEQHGGFRTEALGAVDVSGEVDTFGAAHVLGAAEVFARAGQGDATAASVVHSALIAVAHALAAAVALMDPAAIVIGGGLGGAVDLTSGLLAQRYRALTGRRPSPPPLQRARLGRHSGLVGAALAAMPD